MKYLFSFILSIFLSTHIPVLADSQFATSGVNSEATVQWQEYGGNNAQRYSSLTQINLNNVDKLTLAWEHHSGDFSLGEGDLPRTTMQVTPIMVNQTLYYCSPYGRVFALDPNTGKERWRFDPGLKTRKGGFYPATCRGVSYWQAEPSTPAVCNKRIIYGTRDSQLIALDADTGVLCQDFGVKGRVSLREGIDNALAWEYYPSSPPYVLNNIAVIGALIPDNDRVDAPAGVVRAFDVRNGRLVWAWDPVPPRKQENNAHSGDGTKNYYHGTPNVWAPISGDKENNLIFIPTGNPSPDLFGGYRQNMDYYGSSVVALNADNGKVAWHFQTVHHDLWDYDVASQPALFQIKGVANGKAGILQATKMGHVFLLDRTTGKPLYPVEERPVPHSDIPEEISSATQPFPSHPPPLHDTVLNNNNVGDLTPFDRKSCRAEISKYRNEGIFTPPSLKGSILYPGSIGGMNWGGVSIDPVNGIMYVNQSHIASVVKLIPREEFDKNNPVTNYPQEFYPMKGTPYGVNRFPLLSVLETPCNPRPWGSLAAVDLKTGKTVWQKPLGTTRDQAPFPLWFEWGTPNLGGPLATAGSLLVIGATTDKFLRFYNVNTGELVRKIRIPYTANATPMSYRTSKNSKQFIVVAAGGHGWSEPGDALLAFALP